MISLNYNTLRDFLDDSCKTHIEKKLNLQEANGKKSSRKFAVKSGNFKTQNWPLNNKNFILVFYNS